MVTSVFFSHYQVHYYSRSNGSAMHPEEAAYINCFDDNDKQTGAIVFVYDADPLPANQVNDGNGVMILYYRLHRFNDIINVLRYALKGSGPVRLSIDHTIPNQEIAAVVTILPVPVGSQGCCSERANNKKSRAGKVR